MVEFEKLAGVLARYPEVRAAYVFGSHAEGRGRPDSDLDLALFADPSLREKRLDLLTELAQQGFDRVDLVFVDEDKDLILAYEAVRPNMLIYAAPGFSRGETYSRIVRKFLDFQYFLRHQRQALKEKFLHGSP